VRVRRNYGFLYRVSAGGLFRDVKAETWLFGASGCWKPQQEISYLEGGGLRPSVAP